MHRCRFLMFLAVLFTMVLSPRMASATELIADLSNHLVGISTGFTGANVLLFGTIQGEGDVVVVVRGPENDQVVRRKGRKAGIWVNEAEMVFQDVPSFYAVATSRPLEGFIPDRVASRQQIGVENLRLVPTEDADEKQVAEFRAGLIRNKQRAGLYGDEPRRIAFLGGRLFRTDMRFPANAPVGTYMVQIFLIRDQEVVSAEITPLIVSKLGFEAGVFDFAHRHALPYGVLAILIAVVAGWLASLVFRKD